MKSHRSVWTAVFITAATLAAVAAAARSGPKTDGGGKSLTIAFGDGEGDAIKSDGQGPYDASFKGRDSDFVMSTGSRELFLDFSMPQGDGNDTPFEGDTAGWLSGVTLTIVGVDGPPGSGVGASAFLEFNAPAPDGSGHTQWYLYMGCAVDRMDDDADGTTDRYLLEGTAVQVLWWNGSNQKGHGGRGDADPTRGWTSAGMYDLPWTAVVEKQ
jgi:hypothetical protein